MVRDVLPIGEVAPLALSLARRHDGYLLRVTNPNGDQVEGEAAVVLGTYDSDPVPRPLRVPGGETVELIFPGTGARAVAKVTWYGHVQYLEEEG